MSNLRRPAPEAPATVAYTSRYKRGTMVEAGGHGLGAYNRTAYANKGLDIYDLDKAYVASSWIYAVGTPEQEEQVTGRYFRTPAAARAWILQVAAREGFVTADCKITR